MLRLLHSLILSAIWVRLSVAQQAGWQDGQVNATMCYWSNPRAGVIRDAVYLDGGYLWWEAGLSDGTYSSPVADGNPLGLVYVLNFSTPFDTSQNISSILRTISKASDGGAANNIGPQFVDGTMFVNDYEWFTYGGLLADTLAFESQSAESVAAYRQYPSGPPKQFIRGFALEELPTGITRYLTYGAGVSIPSENLGFYFGGLRSSSWGDIVLGTSNESVLADVESSTLIELDMSQQLDEKWSNYTLPTTVPGRASAEIAWVPVSEQGILVAIGGVIDPSYATVAQANNASVNAESTAASGAFMTSVSVYDISNKIWYQQPTSGQSPPQLAEGCTVVASAEDGSSHNIYWYGGFDGLHQTSASAYSDDVWILSLPSFIWIKFVSGDVTHARVGHRCVKPYPDQMLVIGGTAPLTGAAPTCLDGSIIQNFNLTSGEWLQSYDPKVYSNYTVPDLVVQAIGGSGTGSATQTAPSPTGFANSSLNAIFKQTYNASKITTWYPYQASNTSSPSPTIITSTTTKSKTPSYLAPVLGVVLGLFFVTLLILAFLLYRRRKHFRLNNTNPSENGTLSNHWRVSNWLRGTPADAKAPTVTTDETPTSQYEEEPCSTPEVGGTQVHEMMDTSKPVELQGHDTGFVPMRTPSRGPLPGVNGLASSPSVTSQTSQASSVSRASGHSARPPISPLMNARADSPSLSSPPGQRVLSGVSSFSEGERAHLRGISDTSVSTEGNYATPSESAGPTGWAGGMQANLAGRIVSPITPPHAEAADYVGSRGPQPSPSRKSNFAEGLD